MANFFVRETKAAREISAYVILSPTGEEVATVNIHATASRTIVNVWQSEDAATRSADFANANRAAPVVKHPDEVAAFPFRPTVKPERKNDPFTAALFRFQAAKATGYGFDKKTCALAGLIIDGHAITDHCARLGAPIGPDNGRFPQGYTAPKGYTLSNWFRVDRSPAAPAARRRAWARDGFEDSYRTTGLPDGWAGYGDCYRLAGLGYLEAIGYRVIQAI